MLPSLAVLASLVGGLSPLLFSGELIELAVVFFVLALVAALFGARGIAGLTMSIAKWLVLLFVALALVSLVV